MPFKSHASRYQKIPKALCAAKDWPTFDATLRLRGGVRIWLDDIIEVYWTVPVRQTSKGGVFQGSP